MILETGYEYMPLVKILNQNLIKNLIGCDKLKKCYRHVNNKKKWIIIRTYVATMHVQVR